MYLPARLVPTKNGAWSRRYLALMREDAVQRQHSLRELFNGLRYPIRYGISVRHTQRSSALGGRLPTGAALDGGGRFCGWPRTAMRSPPRPTSTAVYYVRRLESGVRAGYDGPKHKRGSKLHLAVDMLGHLLALQVTSASADDRAEFGRLVEAVQGPTGHSVNIAFVDPGYTGAKPAAAAQAHGIELDLVNLSEAKRLCATASPLDRRTLRRLGRKMPTSGQGL